MNTFDMILQQNISFVTISASGHKNLFRFEKGHKASKPSPCLQFRKRTPFRNANRILKQTVSKDM